MQRLSLPSDIAFLAESGFSVERLVRIVLRAQAIGVHPHQILLAENHISEEAYYTDLARALNLGFVPYPQTQLHFPDSLPLKDVGIACRAGIVCVQDGNRSRYLTAPYGRDLIVLLERLAGSSDLKNHLALTAPERMREALLQKSAKPVLQHSVNLLRRLRPVDSASRSFKPFFALFVLLLSILMLAVLYRAPVFSPIVGSVGAALYLAACFYRILAYADHFERRPAPLAELSDCDLPVCSVLVPLYQEARLVPQLLQALSKVDYPRAKLDILLLVERHDERTARAIRQARPAYEYRLIIVPPGPPHTKPRALQVGLSFARGEMVTIFDAEDVPHPQQLRKAAAHLQAGGPELACLQAELRIDNANCSWLSSQFALEYAALFKIFLPSLAQRGMPVLLGGTSNYFRTAVLRQLGGWDPWNVTEDADLGIRLARAGYRVEVFDTPTEEEAPVTLRNWMRQRLRWQKGWMQTLVVHFSQIRTLRKELGWQNLLGLIATLGVSLLSAFAYPVLMVLFAADVFLDFNVVQRNFLGASVFGMSLAAFVGGHIFPLLHIHAGALRTGHKFNFLSLCTVWIYWLLVSAAAYAALISLVRAPHHWSKTEHLGRQARDNNHWKTQAFMRLRSPRSTMVAPKKALPAYKMRSARRIDHSLRH